MFAFVWLKYKKINRTNKCGVVYPIDYLLFACGQAINIPLR